MALTIIHTADLHNRLDRARAEALGFLRERTGALLLDSGDAIGAPNICVRPSEPVLELMNQAGYAAMALGNREFFFRRSGLVHKTRGARFPVLCANLLPARGELGHIARWTILRAGEERVGVFGLAPTMMGPGSMAQRISDLRFIEWEAAALEAVEALRGRVEWLVALSHRGMTDDLALAELCPQIDAVLGGHDHKRVAMPLERSGILLSHPGSHGCCAAVLRLERDAEGRRHTDGRIVELA
ncbi:MAG: metallophosphoesterase [Armatimonadota bacterium]